MVTVKFDLLKPFVKEFEDVEEELINKWLDRERVINTLERNRLNPEFFKKHFAYKIYDYYLDVIKKEEEDVHCPFVHIFLHFCTDKKVKLHDIYIICSELKNVVVDYFIYTKNSETDDKVYWQIVDLMDANFAAVIEEFMTNRCSIVYECAENDRACSTKITNNLITKKPALSPMSAKAQSRQADIRFSKIERYDSEALFEMLGENITDKIELFTERLDELLITLYDMEESNSEKSHNLMQSVVFALGDFYELVDTFAVFPVIVNTFKNLSEFLSELTTEDYENAEQKKFLVMHLIGLVKDLENWIDIIFIQKAADDVHYFDASFANNVTEIESIFTNQTIIESEEEDLVFF